MRHCVGEDAECNGPDCGHAEDCPYHLEGMKEDSSLRDELERWKQTKKGEETAMEGNQQKMREALEKLVANIEMRLSAFGIFSILDRKTFLDARAALVEPARNCDVGTPEEQTQRMYSEYCRQYECYELPSGEHCPMYREGIDCRLAWAQMPYEAEAKEGSANGSQEQ